MEDKLNLEHINLLFCTCLKPPIKYKLRLSPCKRTQHYWMLDVGSVCAPCCMLLRVVVSSYIKQSLKPVKLLSQRLPTFLWFRDRQSVAQQCYILCTDLQTFLGPRMHITHGLESIMGCILPKMRCRFPTLLGGPFMRYKIMTLSTLLGLKVCVGPNNTQYNEC